MTSFSIFLFPAVAFLTAKYFHPESATLAWRTESKHTKGFYTALAWLFVPMGVIIVISAMVLNALRLFGKIPSDSI